MLKKSDFSGCGGLVMLSVITGILLVQSLSDVLSYPIDIPRLYSFKEAKYMLTPKQNFFIHMVVFLLFSLPTLYAVYKKSVLRVKSEGKVYYEEVMRFLTEASVISFRVFLYGILFLATVCCLVGGTFFILFSIFTR